MAPFVTCVEQIIVVDGDTFKCGPVTIRIAGIDAPDRRCTKKHCATILPNGVTFAQSTEVLRGLLRVTPLSLRYYTGLTYGRRIAVVCAGGVNVSDYMIKNNFATYKPAWNGSARRVKCPQ